MSEEGKKGTCPADQHKVVLMLPVSMVTELMEAFSVCLECGARAINVTHSAENIMVAPGSEKVQ